MGLKKEVIQFKEGIEIRRFGSSVEAAEANGTTKNIISKCCNGIRENYNGYTFSYSGKFTNKSVKKEGDYKCPYCESRFETYNGLAKHIFKYNAHPSIKTKEQLLTDFKYNGVRPTCKCGCGGNTDIAYDGEAHFRYYIRGHASRIHNNWGHNEQAKAKSSETRRRQYDSGERVQWNKGKMWEETYSDVKIEKLRDILSNGIKKRIEDGTFSISSKVEKEFIERCVVPLGLEFSTQHYLTDIKHYCDVYIPSKNAIIEFQGDYWHGNPKKYLKEELTPFQLKKVEKDIELREYCKKNDILLLEIWESEYNDSESGVMEFLSENLLQ